ncbi:MAG TPA: polysaccharide deacetylase family protein [Anaerolineales bacterium]|nr:polysaccharide deacetylase family protein [Anaerolineales bacterium]
MERIQVLYQSGINQNGAEYILKWMLSFTQPGYALDTYQPGQIIAASLLVISYGIDLPVVDGCPHLHIAAASFFFPQSYLCPDLHAGEPIWYENLPLAFPSQSAIPAPGFSEDAQKLVVPDVLASAFFILSRYEEFVHEGPLDSRGRFTAAMSWMGRHGLLHRPLVDEYQLALQKWIKQVAPCLTFRQPNWQGKSFAVAITHDVDSLNQAAHPSLISLARSIKHGEFVQGLKKLTTGVAVHYFNQFDPHNNLQSFIEWERKHGLRSSIYFLSSHVAGDANYRLDDVFKRSSFLREAQQEGWEFGFHPGVHTSRAENVFEQEYLKALACLGNIKGGRQHTLRFAVPETWRFWEKAGMLYDSTLGFADHEGFRCGTCRPFRPFDLVEEREINLWEAPLIVMDNTFTKYRALDVNQARFIMEQLLMAVKRHRGLFVLLWHNTFFGHENAGQFHDLFAEFLQNALEAGAQLGPLSDILSGWTMQRDLQE